MRVLCGYSPIPIRPADTTATTRNSATGSAVENLGRVAEFVGPLKIACSAISENAYVRIGNLQNETHNNAVVIQTTPLTRTGAGVERAAAVPDGTGLVSERVNTMTINITRTSQILGFFFFFFMYK